jgi:hypothetical protein
MKCLMLFLVVIKYINNNLLNIYIFKGKTDGMSTKENQPPTSLRNIVNGWNEPTLSNKKPVNGLNSTKRFAF